MGRRRYSSRPRLGVFRTRRLLLVPFAAAYDAAQASAQSAKCDAKLSSAYLDTSLRLRDVVQREFVIVDFEEKLVDAIRKRSAAAVVTLANPVDSTIATNPQQLLSAAANRGLTYLLVVQVLRVELGPLNVDCEQWAFRVSLGASLWSTADGKRVKGPVFAYPYVNTGLDALKSLMDEPGALRMRLTPNFGIAADDIVLGLTS